MLICERILLLECWLRAKQLSAVELAITGVQPDGRILARGTPNVREPVSVEVSDQETVSLVGSPDVGKLHRSKLHLAFAIIRDEVPQHHPAGRAAIEEVGCSI